MAQMKKADLIKILVEEYGYEKEDIKMLTNAKLQSMIKEEEEAQKELEYSETVSAPKYKEIKDDDLILVMNGQDGELIHRSSRTGRMWRFTRFGQTDKIPYYELLSIYNNNPKAFEQGWLIILNNQVAENFHLTEIYKNIITPENIDDIFKKDIDELDEFIDHLPAGMKTTFISRARKLYEEGKLDSIKLVNLIENKFGFSLEDNAPLSDIAVKGE